MQRRLQSGRNGHSNVLSREVDCVAFQMLRYVTLVTAAERVRHFQFLCPWKFVSVQEPDPQRSHAAAGAQYDQICCRQITGKFKNCFEKSKEKVVNGKRTSLCQRFELIHIFKALSTGCDVGICVWPLLTPHPSHPWMQTEQTTRARNPLLFSNCVVGARILWGLKLDKTLLLVY